MASLAGKSGKITFATPPYQAIRVFFRAEAGETRYRWRSLGAAGCAGGEALPGHSRAGIEQSPRGSRNCTERMLPDQRIPSPARGR